LLDLKLCCTNDLQEKNHLYCRKCGEILVFDLTADKIRDTLKKFEDKYFYAGRSVIHSEDIYFTGKELPYHLKPVVRVKSIEANDKSLKISEENISVLLEVFPDDRKSWSNVIKLSVVLDLERINILDEKVNVRCLLNVRVPYIRDRAEENRWNRWGVQEEEVILNLGVYIPPKIKVSDFEGSVEPTKASLNGVIEKGFKVIKSGGGKAAVKMSSTAPWLSVEPVQQTLKDREAFFKYQVKLGMLYDEVSIGKKRDFTGEIIINRGKPDEQRRTVHIPVYKEKIRYPLLSIDFGTKNTKVAFKADAQPGYFMFPGKYLREGKKESPLLPSQIYINQIGQCFIGEQAADKAIKDTESFNRKMLAIENIKSHLFDETSNSSIIIDGVKYDIDRIRNSKSNSSYLPSVYKIVEENNELILSYNERGKERNARISIARNAPRHFVFFGKVYTAEELARIFIEQVVREVTSLASDNSTDGIEVFRNKRNPSIEVIASIPSFSKIKPFQGKLLNLLEELRFRNPELTEEPVASVFFFGLKETEFDFGDLILVVDSGAGTTDFALMIVQAFTDPDSGLSYKTFKVIASTNTTAAGNQVTFLIDKYLREKAFQEWHENIDIPGGVKARHEFLEKAKNDPELTKNLMDFAEEVKCNTNSSTVYKKDFNYLFEDRNLMYTNTMRFSELVEVTDRSVNTVVKTLDKFIGEVENVLSGFTDISSASKSINFHLTQKELRTMKLPMDGVETSLKKIYLSGGSISFEPLRKAISQRFKDTDTITGEEGSDEAYTCVSLGAVNYKYMMPINILPYTYGIIEEDGEAFIPLHEIYSEYPTAEKEHFLVSAPVRGRVIIGRHSHHTGYERFEEAEAAEKFVMVRYAIPDTSYDEVALRVYLKMTGSESMQLSLYWKNDGMDEYKQLDDSSYDVRRIS
jgi:hypothetical protein